MMKNVFVVILVFLLIFVAFHPSYLEPESSMPTFDEVFEFGYNVTVGPFVVLASVKDGIPAFWNELNDWFGSVFGFNADNLMDFFEDKIFGDLTNAIESIKTFFSTVFDPVKDLVQEIRDKIK